MHVVEKIQRGDVMNPQCPSREILQHLTSRWGLLTMLALEFETLRFSEVRRKLNGVSERMLSQTLRNLENDGLINRTAYDVVIPHVEYNLTPLGMEATQQIRQLVDWIENNISMMSPTEIKTN